MANRVHAPAKDAGATVDKAKGGGSKAERSNPLSAAGNQAVQRSLDSPTSLTIQRKCTCGASAPPNELCDECRSRKIQNKLRLGSAQDPFEREADSVADSILRVTIPSDSKAAPPSISRQSRCGGGGDCDGDLSPQRDKAQGVESSSSRGVELAERVTSGSGTPLPDGTRSFFEARFGRDFGDVRLHTGSDASESARVLGARAYTVGNNIAFGAGELQSNTLEGRRLLAHELTHVLQQDAAPRGVIRREGGDDAPGDAAAPAGDSVADRSARDAGPCSVRVGTLTNEGLLFQLNRARVFVTQHDPHREGSSDSESDYYDYQNLLRRLTRERQRRVSGGHLWLAEPQQISAPPQVYALEPGDLLSVQVRSVAGSTVAGEFAESSTTYLTRSQFERFLSQNNIPTIEMERLLEGEGRDRGEGDPATFDLPERRARRYVLSPSSGGFDPFGAATPRRDPFADLFAPASGAPLNPFMPDPFGGMSPVAPWSLPYRSEEYTPLATETLRDLRRSPGRITSDRPEVLFLPPAPAPAPGAGGPDVFDPRFGGFAPDESSVGGAGALGLLGRPGAMPDGTTGFMWEGSHVTDMSFLYGRPVSRGFRAPFDLHMADTLTGHRGRSTAILNVGTPGSYANDSLFPYAGEAWGRTTGHWRQGSVLIMNADGSPLSAAQIIELMATRTPEMAGEEYRFSPPPEGSEAFAAADAEARRRGLPGFCAAGGANCESVPFDIHRAAAGGGDLSYTAPDGTVVNIGNPEHASARAMSGLMNQPREFWEARGMRRIDLGPRMWGSLGTGVGMGMGMQLWGDYQRMEAGERVAWERNMALAGGFNVAQILAEEYAHTALTTRLAMPVAEGGMGMAGGSAALTSRFATGTGVAVVAAPVMTGTIMAIDPYRDYTTAEYGGAMGRTVLPAAGGAVAMIAYGAAVGSVGGPVGVLVGAGGVIVGLLAYSAVDWLTGDAVESEISERLGAGGCTDGVAPDR